MLLQYGYAGAMSFDFSSMADTPEIIDEALNRFEEVFKHVKKTDKGMVK